MVLQIGDPTSPSSYQFCGNGNASGRVCDPDRILTDDERKAVNKAYFDVIARTEYKTDANVDFCLKQRMHTRQSLYNTFLDSFQP